MNSRTDALFLEALQLAVGAERDAFLAEACAGDAELRRRLDAMLEDDAVADAFFDEPATEPTLSRGSSVSGETPGDLIGRYKLLQEIGEGGFGIVYLAEQLEPVKRRVALKVLKPGMDTREVVARFETERQSLALMDHPNIARIFDGGATPGGRPYFVMELVNGVPLTKYCDDEQLTTRRRLGLFLDVLAAVQHAHQKGIIHRDLKPSNILVSRSVDFQSTSAAPGGPEVHATAGATDRPHIKIIDFGIAKAISLELTEKTVFTAHGWMIGTPQYMSPEQAEVNALDVDTRSDIYSLGVILYELLTGRTPLDAKKLRAVAYAEIQRLIREEEPPKPSTRITTLGEALADVARQRGAEPEKLGKLVRGDLDCIVMKCLEKDRSRRYETANGFAADLRRHLENQPVLARPPGSAYLFSRFVRRHKIGFAAGATVSVALLAGIAAAVWGIVRAEVEAARTKIANEANKQNLHLASMADYASAVKELDEDFRATSEGRYAMGFAGKSRWYEGVVLLTRSLEREPENTAAAIRLYETLRSRQAEKRDRSLFTLKHDRVRSTNFSPDGSRIVTTSSGDKIARIWDAATGHVIGGPLRHEDIVISANFSPNSTGIVTASRDKTARVWNAATGQGIGQPMRHERGVISASFSPDGTRIVTASEGDRTARIWDATTGHAIGPPLRHEKTVESANFSPDGTRIVTASWDKTARIWDTATGQGIGQPMHHEQRVWSANFSPDGTRIVTVSADKTARVWDAATGQGIGQPMRHERGVISASFSPDGTRIVTVSEDETARVWDAATGQKMGEPMRHKKGMIMNANFSPDGSRIVTTSWGDETARIWDATTGHAIGETLLHEAAVLSANFSPDGTRIITASQDKTARVWDAATGHVIGTPLRHEGWVWSANFSPDGTRIVTASTDKTAQVWDTATGQFTGQPMHHEQWVWSANFSPDGTRIVTASADNTARVWDTATGQVIGQPMRHEMSVLGASFSPDGTRIVTVTGIRYVTYTWDRTVSSPDNTAQVWDAATGHVIGKPLRHEDGVMSANFSPDGSQIVTASEDKTARVWDAVTGRGIGRPMRHEGRVMSANFSPDGTRIVTASGFNIARVWWVLTKDESKAIHSITPEILAWARNFSGLRYCEDGEFHLIPDDERIAGMTTALPAGPWADLARWINTPTPQRTIDPKSKVTLRQIAERERDFGSVESALRYDPAIPLAHLFLAKAIEELDTALAKYRDSSIPQRNAFLRRYDLDALAREAGRMKNEDLAALWVRAANHLHGLPPETKIGVGPKPTMAREEAGKAARKALELVPGWPAAEEVLSKFMWLEWSKKIKSLVRPKANAANIKSKIHPTNPCHE